MSYCSTCGPMGNQQQDEQLTSILIKAKAHAKEIQVAVAVYKDEEGRWTYINAFTAAEKGIPLTKLVSFDRNAANEQVH